MAEALDVAVPSQKANPPPSAHLLSCSLCLCRGQGAQRCPLRMLHVSDRLLGALIPRGAPSPDQTHGQNPPKASAVARQGVLSVPALGQRRFAVVSLGSASFVRASRARGTWLRRSRGARRGDTGLSSPGSTRGQTSRNRAREPKDRRVETLVLRRVFFVCAHSSRSC